MPVSFAHRTGNRDAEDALAALQQVDDLFGGGALVDGGAIREQCHSGKVLDTALAQVVDGDADVLQRDARVQQALDDLENQDVLEEYNRWLPDPAAPRIDGTTSDVRAQ